MSLLFKFFPLSFLLSQASEIQLWLSFDKFSENAASARWMSRLGRSLNLPKFLKINAEQKKLISSDSF